MSTGAKKVTSSLAVIGGTGFGHYPGSVCLLEAGAHTPFGDAAAQPRLLQLETGGTAWFLPRHGDTHALAPHQINYCANIQALADAGVESIVAVAAVGGISADATPGSVVLVDDLIDYTYGRTSTFCDFDHEPLSHVEFAPPYAPGLRAQLAAAAQASQTPLLGNGVLGVTQGPRLETAAEIRRLANDGCTVVGMTGMPEAALAAERGLAYACLAVVVNPAAGTAEGSIHAAIEENLNAGMSRVRQIIERWISDANA